MAGIIDYSMGNVHFYNAFYIDAHANKDDEIQRIVLNPEVAYEFDKRGIRYAKLEDYYSEREFLKNISLFLEIDTYICHSLYDIFAENDIGLERDDYLIFFYYIKTHVESLFVRFYIYRELFDRLDRVSEVIYYCAEDREDDSDYMALEYFSKICAFKLEKKIVSSLTQLKFHTSTLLQIKLDFISHLFNKIRTLIVQNIKCLKLFHKWALNCKGDVLFLSDSRSLSELAHIKTRQGYRTWFCNREATLIELRGSYFKKRITGIGTFNKLRVNSQKIDDVANYISYRLGLIDAYWVTRRLRKVIELLIQPSIGKYFFLKDNPRLVDRFKEIISDGYYINYRNSFFLYFYKFKRGAMRTIVKHGDDPWRVNGVKYIELLFANNYICEKTGSELLLKEIATTWKQQVEFDTQGLLFNVYRRLKVERKKKPPLRIIYLPTFFSGKFRRLDGIQYPAIWYYSLQKKIIDSFIHEKSFIFIWKGFSQMGSYAAVLDRYISDISAINVRFSFKILAEELKNAYALITDYPSTGMYEAAFAGCPVFGVYPDWFPINKYALEFWGKCLKSYSQEDEVVKYFKEFIYSKDIQTYHPTEFPSAGEI